jgi:hypothetical protein
MDLSTTNKDNFYWKSGCMFLQMPIIQKSKITSPLISERFDMVANKMSYLKMWNQDGFIDQINE